MGGTGRSATEFARRAAFPLKMPLAVRDLRLLPVGLVSLIALTLGLLGSWTVQGAPELAVTRRPVASTTIWVADNGFHTDLILPREALDQGGGPLARAVRTLEPGDWVAVGWGDARFYTDARPISERLPDGARAFLWPGNASVILLDPIERAPDRAHLSDVAHPATLSGAGLEALRARLERSFAVEDGAAVPGPAVQVGNGRFFQSVETFWIGHLCNHWAAELLHAGGLSIRPFRTIFSAEIVRMAHSGSETSGMPDRADETNGHDA